MNTPKVFDSEYQLCLIVWENEPMRSPDVVKLCKERLGWAKPTTYTVIRRLCERGILQNVDTVVSSLVSKEEVQQSEMDELMEKTFLGSVPAFIAAFAKNKSLTKEDADILREMIDKYEGK